MAGFSQKDKTRLIPVFKAILTGAYTPLDLREFVLLCHDLALPFLRKKIHQGKLNLASIRLNEHDAVYDCLADLFARDDQGNFQSIRKFFDAQLPDWESGDADGLIVTLRHLVFAKINNGIIRLYSEADPALGKILRNMKKALETRSLFEQTTRFGDVFLVPAGADPLFHLPPLAPDQIQRAFSLAVLLHDNVPTMLSKLRSVLIDQNDCQRSVLMMTAALMFKEIYELGGEEASQPNVAEERLERERLGKIITKIRGEMWAELHPGYVGKGKCSEEIFAKYLDAMDDILQGFLADDNPDGFTFYEHLRAKMPELTPGEYRKNHRITLEYFAKVGRERIRKELKSE